MRERKKFTKEENEKHEKNLKYWREIPRKNGMKKPENPKPKKLPPPSEGNTMKWLAEYAKFCNERKG